MTTQRQYLLDPTFEVKEQKEANDLHKRKWITYSKPVNIFKINLAVINIDSANWID